MIRSVLYLKVFKTAPRWFSSYAVLDQICELAASIIRYGQGSTAEIGMDLKEMGAKRVLVVTDKNIEKLPSMQVLLQSLDRNNVEAVVYNDVRVESNDISFKAAMEFMKNQTRSRSIDALAALGCGSVVDTAKAVNLYHCYPPQDFYDCVNASLGKGARVPRPLLPLFAVPRTDGTNS